MLPDILILSSETSIGMCWFCITSGWITWGILKALMGRFHPYNSVNPFRNLMNPKLTEMDAIINRIWGTMNADTRFGSPLMVVLGDHGMNQVGFQNRAKLTFILDGRSWRIFSLGNFSGADISEPHFRRKHSTW